MGFKEDIAQLTVKIGGIPFKVRLEEDMILRFGHQGQVNFIRDEIILDPIQTNHEIGTVFLHELIEGIIKRHQIELPHELIVLLECALYSLFMDNPRILEIYHKFANGEYHEEERQEETPQTFLEGILNFSGTQEAEEQSFEVVEDPS